MTNDKDGAALLREAMGEDRKWLADDIWLSIPAYMRKSINKAHFTALQWHGQAIDAAGVREAVGDAIQAEFTRMAPGYLLPNNLCNYLADAAIRALPIPEAPASVEPVEYETLIAAGFDDYAARCALRTDPDGVFCHAYFYSDGQWRFQTGGNDLTLPDGTTLRCVLTKPLYTHPEPDTIGSHFGNGGELDPVRSFHVEDCEASPGFGGGDLREALRDMPDQIFQSIAESKTAATCRERVAAMIAALPPVKQSVGKFQRGDHVEKISGSKWRGKIVGEYATELTPEGYAVESDTETGSVQIYPAKALRPFADCCDQIADTEDDEEWAKFRLLIKDYRRASQALEASR